LTGAATDTLPVGPSPAGVAVTPDGHKAYVSCAGEVSVIDLKTMTILPSIPIASAMPGGVAISATGTQVFVPEGDLADVVVIDVATDTTVGTPISVGDGPLGVATRPDGLVLVSNFNDDTVSVIVGGVRPPPPGCWRKARRVRSSTRSS
jgi:DNA-binding beta-propeller fold protein YncE